MKKSDFYFDLPEELIAQTPLERRDASRLLTLDKTTGAVAHHHFYELPQFLRPNDCLVLNDSRVLPARLLGHRSTGGAVEVLLLRDPYLWFNFTPLNPVALTAQAPGSAAAPGAAS